MNGTMCRQACDTLRTDDDTGDECIHCGTVYSDTVRRHIALATRQVVAHQPTSSPGVAPRATRGVTYHSFNFGPSGGRGLAFRSGKR